MFSILCATHDQADFLPDMLSSVLNQTREDWELVIVDDGSTDGTGEVLRSWRAALPPRVRERITVVRTEQGGQSAAYELGFERTRGQWICLLDSDDAFQPHKLETVAQAVCGRDDIGLVQHPLIVIDAAGRPTGEMRPQAASLSSGDLRHEMRRDARHVAPGASGLVVRRSVFERLVPFPTKAFRFAADAYISFGATALVPVLSLNHPLALYRMQPGGQYLRRMLDADGLAQQVTFQEVVAAHFGLSDAARRNSFFCRNAYAADRLGGGHERWELLARLLRATAGDRHFSRSRKVVLMGIWTFSAMLPRPGFARLWRSFQMRQTGWRRILATRSAGSAS
ncbi:glycosyltransferase [Kineococcus sp. GCM10028916]|uniref:glycosyltransferase n=1 Tax=Kineococcus sp. GCM10028916 TaxID=3273394 RepID=UPI0036D272D5